MEMLKNLIHPGKAQEDEALYGTGEKTGKTGGLTGEGSHLASNTGNTSGLAGSQTTGTTGTSGLGSTSTGVPSEATTDQSGRPIGSGTTGTSGLGGQGSHLAGATSGTSSGVTGDQTSGLGNTSTSTGHGQSNFARDAATTAAATTAGDTGFGHHGAQPTSSTASHMPGGWDETPGTQSRNNSYLGSSQPTTGLGSNTGVSQLGSSTGSSAVPQSTSGHPTQATSGLGSHTDSSVPQSTNTSSGHHLGRDAAALGTAGAVGEGIHHHREDPSIGSTSTTSGYPSTAQDSQHQSELGSAKVLGTTTSHSTRLPSGSSIPATSAVTQSPHYSAGLPDRSVGSQQPSSTTGYGSQQTGTTSSDHHLGRDAAVAGGAGALGGAALHHHQDQHNLRDKYTDSSNAQPGVGNEYAGTSREMPLSSSQNNPSGFSQGSQAPVSGSGYSGSSSHPVGSDAGSSTIQGGNTSSGHHLGRDAAVAGGAGALGGSALHHHQDQDNLQDRHREQGRGVGSSGIDSGSQNYGSSSGPHKTYIANMLDPHVSGGASRLEDAHHHDLRHGGGAEEADQHHTPTVTSSKDQHHGRDAAAGAGGVGALGLAEHEHRKHENPTSGTYGAGSHQPTLTNTSASQQPSSTSGHHYGRDTAVGAGGVGAAGLAGHEYEKHRGENTSGAGTSHPTSGTYGAGSQQPISTSTSSHQPSSTSDHHYGRDAAAVGGVGAAGYEAEKHLGKHNDSSHTGTSGPSTAAGNTTAPRAHNDMFGFSHKSNPNIESQHHTTGYQDPTTNTQQSKDHHYGRDAAVAGGVGGAAYEAEHHKHDKDLTKAEHDSKKQHKHDEKEAKKEAKELKKEHKHDEHHKEKKGGLLSFLHRDKNKKYTPEEDAEFDRQEREHNSSHTGRDAALGTAGAGALGAGAYEAEKHHHGQTGTSSDKPLPHAPGNHGVGTGAGTQNALASDNTTGQSGHHYGRDAALGTGAAGAAGYGAHEHNQHQGATPLAEKPVGSDLGDKLHGSERNRGVPGASGFPGSEGYGAGAASGPGSHIHSEASTDQYGNPIGPGVSTGTSGYGSQEHGQHHLGRDAALGAGAVGAGGVAAHEYGKHDSGYQNTPSSTGHQFDNNTSSGLPGSQQQGQHHYGRDATAAGGVAGAGALGEHEYRKHEGTSGHQGSNLTGGNNQYDGASSGHHTGSHHHGHDAAAVGGAGALGEHEYRKHDNTSGHQAGLGQQSGIGSNDQYQQSGSGFTGSDDITDPRNDGRVGPHVAVGEDGRHRLHKDPPASHPAAHAASGTDTGVGHLGNERSNY